MKHSLNIKDFWSKNYKLIFTDNLGIESTYLPDRGKHLKVLSGIASSFSTFRNTYLKKENNILQGLVFFNTTLKNICSNYNCLPANTSNIYKLILSRVRLCDFYSDPENLRLKHMNVFCAEFLLTFSYNEKLRLTAYIREIEQKFSLKKKADLDNPKKFLDFLKKPAKGCKKIRLLLNSTFHDKLLAKKHNFINYLEVKLSIDVSIDVRKINFTFNKLNFLELNFLEFINNYNQNKIHSQDRLSKYLNVSDLCCLCVKNNVVHVHRDSFENLFYSCKFIKPVWTHFLDKFNIIDFVEDGVNMRRELLFKTTALFGPPHLKRNFNRDKLYIILLDLYVIRFFIFNIRRKNLRCVSINAIENYLNLFRELHAKCNRKYRSMLDLIND